MLEWNNKLFDIAGGVYSSLAKKDEGGLYSGAGLPATLDAARLLVIDINTQLMHLVECGMWVQAFQVSTAINGAGCRENTGCTPLGWHRIAEKIGDQKPLGTIFKGRCVAGLAESFSSTQNDDLITSRILWLSGLQPGLNAGGSVDSYSRYIYIHGTAQEHLLGSAVSQGCIRMHNNDVIELFDRVDAKTIVHICHSLTEYYAAL